MQKKRKLEKQRRESETNDAKKLGLEKQSLISSVGQMKLVMQENFGLKKSQSVISNVRLVKLMMQENFIFKKSQKLIKNIGPMKLMMLGSIV